MGLLSGRGALLGCEPKPQALAMTSDDQVLLASGCWALEQALDVSQIDDINQSADPALRRWLGADLPVTSYSRPGSRWRYLLQGSRARAKASTLSRSA